MKLKKSTKLILLMIIFQFLAAVSLLFYLRFKEIFFIAPFYVFLLAAMESAWNAGVVTKLEKLAKDKEEEKNNGSI